MNEKADIGTAVTKHSVNGSVASVASLAVVAGYLWVYVEPKARDLIEQEVDRIFVAGDFAKSKDVQMLNRNVEQAEQRIRDLERKQDSNSAKAEAERKAIRDAINDQKELLRDVLRMRRRTE